MLGQPEGPVLDAYGGLPLLCCRLEQSFLRANLCTGAFSHCGLEGEMLIGVARDPRRHSGLPLSGPGRRTLRVLTGPTSMMNWRERQQARALAGSPWRGPMSERPQRQDAHCTTVGAPLAAAGAAVAGTRGWCCVSAERRRPRRNRGNVLRPPSVCRRAGARAWGGL
jgi:hypothetical protein